LQGGISNYLEKIISVPLNHDNRSEGYFDLFYYLNLPREWPTAEKKTVLFVTGGPGRINKPGVDDNTLAMFLTKNQYQIVNFHLRGAGHSQVPASNDFDKFLRTRYAVDDIEQIRRDLKRQNLLRPDGKWDAIIAWSYGTVLAQQYAHKHSDKVEKLVLLGPISRHGFALLPDSDAGKAFDALNQEDHNIQRESLNQMLRLLQPEFQNVNEDPEKKKLLEGILEQVFGGPSQEGILPKTEDLFDNVQYVSNHYCEIVDILKARELAFSKSFFETLAKIRMQSRFSIGATDIGRAVFDELSQRGNVPEPKSSDACLQPAEFQDILRDLYVIDAYDGIDTRFLKNWLGGGKKDFRAALRGSVGTSGANPYIGKVGVADDVAEIRPWNPADHRHDVPTLILKGGADPVSVGGAAEQFFSKGITGPRTLINFPGVGHQFTLRADPKPNWNGTVRLDPTEIAPKQLGQIIGTVVGTKLDERYRLTLEPSNTTREDGNLVVMGFGLLRDELIDSNKASKNITAIFKNVGNKLVDPGRSDWIINHALFTATARFDLPPVNSGDTVQARGTIVSGKRRRQVVLKASLPDGNNNGLEVPCYKILPDKNMIQFWYVNTGEERTDLEDPRTWTISDESSEQSFRVDKYTDPVKKGVLFTNGHIPNMTLDPDDPITPAGESDRKSKFHDICIPREQPDPLTREIILWNKDPESSWKLGTSTWLVKNDLYTLSITINAENGSDEVPSNGFKKVTGNIDGVILTEKRPRIMTPEELKDTLDWQAINVLENNQIAVILEKKKETKISDALKDWPYQDPNMQKTNHPCGGLQHEDMVRDCLIYSFLVMDKEHFRDTGLSGPIKNVLRKNFHDFPSKGDKVRITHCPRGECPVQ